MEKKKKIIIKDEKKRTVCPRVRREIRIIPTLNIIPLPYRLSFTNLSCIYYYNMNIRSYKYRILF